MELLLKREAVSTSRIDECLGLRLFFIFLGDRFFLVKGVQLEYFGSCALNSRAKLFDNPCLLTKKVNYVMLYDCSLLICFSWFCRKITLDLMKFHFDTLMLNVP